MPSKGIFPVDTLKDDTGSFRVSEKSTTIGRKLAKSDSNLSIEKQPFPFTQASQSQSIDHSDISPHEKRLLIVDRQRKYSTMQFTFGIFGVVMMVIQMEYLWYRHSTGIVIPCPINPKSKCPECSTLSGIEVPQHDMLLSGLRILISFSTMMMLYYQYYYYQAECDFMKIKNIFPPQATLFSSYLIHPFSIEFCLYSIHPFPFLESIDWKWPNLLILTSVCMFGRILLIARVAKFRSALNTSNGWFIGSLTNVEFTAAFFLKTALKNYPGRFMILCLGFLLGTAGYSLYVIERFLCAFNVDSCCQPISLADAEWMLIVTILTIGYGDIVPKTDGGRLVAIVGGLMGTLITAVTIALTTNYLNLTRSEHKVNTFLQKDANKRLINEHSARAIQICIEVYVSKLKFKKTGSSSAKRALEKAELKMYNVLRIFRKMKRYVHVNDGSDPIDRQMTMLETMELNVEEIKNKMESLIQTIFEDEEEMNSDEQTHADSVNVHSISNQLEKFSLDKDSSSNTLNNRSTSCSCSFNHDVSGGDSRPEWAGPLDTMMNSILEQVSLLGLEMELVKKKVSDHISEVNDRMTALEQKLGSRVEDKNVVNSENKKDDFSCTQ